MISRDLTPKELDEVTKLFGVSNIIDTLKTKTTNGMEYAYNEQKRKLSQEYPRLISFASNLLFRCNKEGLLKYTTCRKLIMSLEIYYKTGEIQDEDLKSMADNWYNGKLKSGREMSSNDTNFISYLKSRITKEEVEWAGTQSMWK